MDIEKIKELLNKVPYILVVCVYLLYLGYDYFTFSANEPGSPLYNKLQERDGLDTQVAKLKKKVERTKEFYANLQKKKQEIRGLAVELNGLKGTLSEELDVPSFIKTVVTEAKRVGLKVRSLAPLNEVKRPMYVEQKFKFDFTGAYVQIIVFLEHLSKVKKIVLVDSISLNPQGSQSAQYVQLKGSMDLKVYKYVGSKADEILKKAEESNS